MSRTNVDIDDEACAIVMRLNGLATKREAINMALRKAAEQVLSTEQILALGGTMPDFELADMPGDAPPR